MDPGQSTLPYLFGLIPPLLRPGRRAAVGSAAVLAVVVVALASFVAFQQLYQPLGPGSGFSGGTPVNNRYGEPGQFLLPYSRAPFSVISGISNQGLFPIRLLTASLVPPRLPAGAFPVRASSPTMAGFLRSPWRARRAKGLALGPGQDLELLFPVVPAACLAGQVSEAPAVVSAFTVTYQLLGVDHSQVVPLGGHLIIPYRSCH